MSVILSLKDMSISFGGLKAVQNLSFDIEEKQIFGLIGPNGAGKTTVFNCITHFYNIDKGSIDFTDKSGVSHDLTNVPVHNIIKLGIVRTFQNVEVIKTLSILDNILIGGTCLFKHGLFANALKLPSARREENEMRNKAMAILEFTGLSSLANQYAGGQPYGVLKMIELSRTLMCNPRLIILDEPAAGLNENETEIMSNLILKIRDDYNASILLVEHDMRLVMNICDKICAISFGEKLAEGSPLDIQNNKDVQEAYLGKDDE